MNMTGVRIVNGKLRGMHERETLCPSLSMDYLCGTVWKLFFVIVRLQLSHTFRIRYSNRIVVFCSDVVVSSKRTHYCKCSRLKFPSPSDKRTYKTRLPRFLPMYVGLLKMPYILPRAQKYSLLSCSMRWTERDLSVSFEKLLIHI